MTWADQNREPSSPAFPSACAKCLAFPAVKALNPPQTFLFSTAGSPPVRKIPSVAALAFSDGHRRSASGSVAGVGVGNGSGVGCGGGPGRIATPVGAAGVGPAEQHNHSPHGSPIRRNTASSFAAGPSPASVSVFGGGTRRRNVSIAGLDSSPGSIDDIDEAENNANNTHDDRRKQPVKRACNECRQQKVRRCIGIVFFLLIFCFSFPFDCHI